MKPRLFVPLLALILVKGMLFCALIIPWMGPDEGLRFEFARLFSQTGLRTLTPVSEEKNQKEILASMTHFGVWKLMDMPEPAGDGLLRFRDSPLQKDTPSTTYPPFYYLWLGNVWRFLGIEYLLTQLFFGRLLSLFLGYLQLLILARLAAYAWPMENEQMKVSALVFVAFLPQWSYLSAVVHPDNWSNFLSASILLCFVQIASSFGWLLGKSSTPPHTHRIAMQTCALFALLLLMAVSTRATPMLLAILLVTSWLLLAQLMRSRGRQYARLAWITAAAVVGIILISVYLLQRQDLVNTGLGEAVGRGLMQRGAQTPMESGGTLFSRLERVSVGGLFRSLTIVFTTFWLALGTLVNKLEPGWLLGLSLLCLASLRGLLRKPRLTERPNFWSVWLLLIIAPLIVLAAVLFVYGPHQEYAPEGRYLQLVLPAIAFLLVEGWQRCWSERDRRVVTEVWICGWILLNFVVLFRYIVPLYYL